MQNFILVSFFLIFPLFSQAGNNSAPFVEGKDYRIVDTPLAEHPETQIFFWYGCKSCYQLFSLLDNQPISWKKTPVSIYKSWRQQTKIFFTLRGLKAPFSIDQQLMSAIHNGDLSANDLDRQKIFLMNTDIDYKVFEHNFYSESVNQLATNTDKIKQQIQITKIPSALIGGKYYVDLSMSKTLQRFTQSILYLEKLIEKESPQQGAEQDKNENP